MEMLALRPLFVAQQWKQQSLSKYNGFTPAAFEHALPGTHLAWPHTFHLRRGNPGTVSRVSSKGRLFASQNGNKPTPDYAVLLEVEGVLSDVHRFGHRQAFNVGFQELGLDCANWSEPVYADLLRRSGGIEEKMLRSFFNQIGWPTSLPTDENPAFVAKIMEAKKRALEELAATEDLPLRPGVDKFVDEVLTAGLPLVVITAYSRSGDHIASVIVDKLGTERLQKLKVVGDAEVEKSAYGKVLFGSGILKGTDEQLAAEASKAVVAEKQRLAEEVASILKLSVELDSSFTQVSKKVVAALRAGAESAGVEAQKCILLSGGHVGIQAATQVGMPCVIVRSSVTARAEYPAARASIDGFGPGALTLSRLLRYI